MFTFRIWTAVCVLAFASMTATAAPKVYTIPAFVVGTYTSTPNETRDAFVRRVATVLVEWTDRTGTEACGALGTSADGQAWRVVLTTQKAQTVCIRSLTVPNGWTATGESIHSHPAAPKGWVKLNDQDRTVAKALGDRDDTARPGRWVRAEPAEFSDDDYAGGPGWLVSRGRLLYQHGKGTAEDLGAVTGTQPG